jgi:hypothetical protein
MSEDHHNDEIVASILASIAALPLAEQARATERVIGAALKQMSVETLRRVRADIATRFGPGIAVVDATLDLIDGQLTLREIAGGEEDWR